MVQGLFIYRNGNAWGNRGVFARCGTKNALNRYSNMTHNILKRLIRAIAPVALAIAMVFSGPVLASFHLVPPAAAPITHAANETVVFKQQTMPAAYAETTPVEAGISI